MFIKLDQLRENIGHQKIPFIRYIFVGCINYPFNIILVWFGSEIMGLYYLFSVAIAHLIITLLNYFWTSSYIFKAQRSHKVFFKYICSLAIISLMHLLLVKILTDIFDIFYLYSVATSISILFLVKFFIYNKLIFTDNT